MNMIAVLVRRRIMSASYRLLSSSWFIIAPQTYRIIVNVATERLKIAIAYLLVPKSMAISFEITSPEYEEKRYYTVVWMREVTEGVMMYTSPPSPKWEAQCIGEYTVAIYVGACIHALIPTQDCEVYEQKGVMAQLDPGASKYRTFAEYACQLKGVWQRAILYHSRNLPSSDGKH